MSQWQTITVREERVEGANGEEVRFEAGARPGLPWRLRLSIALGAILALALLITLFVIAIPIAIALLALAGIATAIESARRRLRAFRGVDRQGRRNVRIVQR